MAAREEIGKVASKDGTQIAYAKSGSGSPLVMVHGGTSDHFTWRLIAQMLEQRFTMYGMDRRGRGESGDSADYTIEREYEDVAAVVDSIAEPVVLFGHSFGGRCALEAALLTDNVRTLILYEPVLVTEPAIIDVVGEVERLLEQGKREQALLHFLTHPAGAAMSQAEIEQLKQSPVYELRIAAAHTIPREIRAIHDSPFDPSKFQALTTPTLVLIGGDSPHWFLEGAKSLESVLPDARLVTLPGQRHVAHLTAPDLLARAIIRFNGET